MSSMPQNTSVPPTVPLKAASSKPNFDIDDWDQISSQKFLRKKMGLKNFYLFEVFHWSEKDFLFVVDCKVSIPQEEGGEGNLK
jgi:hypothetical protein